MIPCYFGNAQRQLYGVFHPASAKRRRGAGILICPPIGQEYMRSHRALRQLASMLAKSGFDVFRFDYYGTGDSAGEFEQGNLGEWQENIVLATEELMANAQIKRVSILGLRFGGTLATLASSRLELDKLVLWDPIINGRSYLQEMVDGELQLQTDDDRFQVKPDLSVEEFFQDQSSVGILGYPITSGLRAALGEINLVELKVERQKEIALFVSAEREEITGLQQKLVRNGSPIHYQHIPTLGDWCATDAFGGALIPQSMIHGIAAYFSGEQSR